MIKAYDGQTVRNAMIDALVAQELERQRSMRETELEGEIARLRDELAMRRQKDAYIYGRLVEDAREHYPDPERVTLIERAAWAVIGWVVLAFGALFERLGV